MILCLTIYLLINIDYSELDDNKNDNTLDLNIYDSKC